MPSEKRIAASRANGTKSRGPTSATGKRNSSLNATRHGILANSVVLESESPERFAALLNSFNGEFQPETATERVLVEKMAVAHWRLLRLWTVESAAINHEVRLQADSMTDENTPTRSMLAMRALADNSRHSELLSRYEQRFDRQHYRALEALTRLQEQRRQNARAERTLQTEENKELVQ